MARDGIKGAKAPRRLTVRVSAKGRSISSRRWLERQLNDPYVAEARRLGFRSRAAFKLEQLNAKLGLLKRGMRVVDLGAAPGGWTQFAAQKVGAGGTKGGQVVAVDLIPMEAVAGAAVLTLDILDPEALPAVRAALGGPADLVLSDMAPPATGHPPTDHIRIVGLAEAALDFAEAILAPGGSFVAKVWQGGSEKELLARLKRRFAKLRHVKPAASRAESAELYVVATDFRPADSPSA